MGLFSGLFGKKTDTSAEHALLIEEQQRARDEKERTDALKRKIDEDRNALKSRSANMQGGGRAGLMFGGNERGVV